MADNKSRLIINRLAKKWKSNVLLSQFFTALAVTSLAVVLLHKLFLLPFFWAFPMLVLAFVIIVFLKQQWKVSELDVAGFLNKQYPQFQESAHLALQPHNNLNFLQKLQVQKVEQGLEELEMPKHFNKKLTSSLVFLLVAALLSFILFKLPLSQINFNSEKISKSASTGSNSVSPEKILPEIKLVKVQVTPPAYTNKGIREQPRFNLLVEEGATVNWHLQTNVAAKKIQLLFNDKQVISLRPLSKGNTSWAAVKSVTKAGFYQVIIDNKSSEFYKIETIKDNPPVINIQVPKPNTTIDFGMPQQVTIAVALSDDYGINETAISVTISSGSGEAVKFKEQQLNFTDFKSGGTKYNLKKLIDLKRLGIEPGDELYFYIKAKDNHQQEKRSDVYIVSLPDTADLMTMEGMANGLDLKPEYFRSERQIIIETEQLLKDKDTISLQEFNNRSNNLGIDQKLLRLRYGKFLGEETDADIGGEHDHDEANHNDAADFGNAEKMIDAVTHKHDNAEDATFFEPAQKAQLKATLSEMWKAELQLRINKPQDALPFEYKALRLLKDLQQKSRAYVAKTSTKTTPLKPEKRLTGELDKIIEPVSQQQFEKTKDTYEVSRRAAGLLGLVKTGKPLTAESIEVLRQAGLQLYSKAAAQPAVYLPAVTAMNKVLSAMSKKQQAKTTDIAVAENGLQKLLTTVIKLPASAEKNSTNSLSTQYFKNLHQRQ
jgi:hypothetical protein